MLTIAAPIISREEIAAVNAVLESGILAQGAKVAELEAAFAQYCGTQYAVAVNSGTAALHCALYAAGVGVGDEVITTPFSFIATINPILMIGAKPVLVDIEPESFNIDAQKVEQAITAKTKAIMPVHLYGQPSNMDEINKLAEAYNLKIIEDACQAVGSQYKGNKAGNLGDIGCFSLYATKNIMSGEGGMLTTNNEAYAQAARQFRQHGMTGPYEYTDIGYNYRMMDLQAAIAVEQLKKVDNFNSLRIRNADVLSGVLQTVPGITIPVTMPDRTHVYQQYTIRITKEAGISRESLMEALKSKDIGSGIYYPKPLHVYPHIAKLGFKIGDFPNAERAAEEVLSLPVHPKITAEDAQLIATTIKEVVYAAT